MDQKPGVYACLRCKARKIKCDRGMPKCTPCERAHGACLTIDPASGRQIPRGYISHLEGRVRELEAELAQARRGAAAGAATPAWPAESELPFGLPGCGVGGLPGAPPRPPAELLDRASPLSLPLDLPAKADAERLLAGYFERSNALVPVVHREQFVRAMFEPVYGPLSPDVRLCNNFTVLRLERSAAEPQTGTFYRRWVDCGGSLTAVPEPRIQVCLFFLYMVFSIAIVTDEGAIDGHPEEGSRMHAAAMCYYNAVACDAGPANDLLRNLQALLLRAVYGLIVPSHPSAWYATGTAMRMCINLGLHNETRVKLDAEEHEFLIDMRRRLFWCTYYMDRIVSVYLGRPVNIGDEYIHCELPAVADDSWLMPPEDTMAPTANTRQKGLSDNAQTSPHLSHRPSLSTSRPQVSRPEAPPDRPSYKWVFRYVLQLRRIQHAAKALLYDRADFDEHTSVREARDRIVADLEKWYNSLPHNRELFNFDFNPRYMEVSYYYTLMLLFRSSRGIPNPTIEDTRRMLTAGTRVLALYVHFHDTAGLVYTWAAVHNVLHASSSCLFGLYRTNLLDIEFDLNEFEHLIEQIMLVVSKLKTRYDASPSAYGPLHTMMRVTLDFLRVRGEEPWRKRAKVAARVPLPLSRSAPGGGGGGDAAPPPPLAGSNDSMPAFPGGSSFAASKLPLPQTYGALSAAMYATQLDESSSMSHLARVDSNAAVDSVPVQQVLTPMRRGPASSGHEFRSHGNGDALSGSSGSNGHIDAGGGLGAPFNAPPHDAGHKAMSSVSTAAKPSSMVDLSNSNLPVPGAEVDQQMSQFEIPTDPTQPMLVPRAMSESLAPMIPGYTEDTQYNEFEVYDILDEISLFFDVGPTQSFP